MARRSAVVLAGLALPLTLLVNGSPGGVPGAGASTAPESPLLVDATGAPSSTPDRARRAEVAPELLGPRQQRLTLELGPDQVEVDLVPAPSGADGVEAWAGTVVGEPDSTVTIVRSGEDLGALVSTPDGAWRVRNVGPGRHTVAEVVGPFVEGDDTLEPTDELLERIAPPPSSGGPEGAADEGPTAAGDVSLSPVVDVLVAYTPEVLATAGSEGAVAAEAALAVADSNASYGASGVTGALRLAGVVPVSPTWGPDGTGLVQLTVDGDGLGDVVHDERDARGADLVIALTDVGGSCGIAWVLDTLTTDDRALGFGVVEWGCAVDNHSFAHEVGHLMGLAHDRYVTTSNSLFPYGFGYVDTVGRWRTVMAYNDQCVSLGFSCTRLGRFSNPDQLYGGRPLGKPSGQADAADSRQALDQSQAVVADYRARTDPFTTWSRFVSQQYRDILGRGPTSAESAAAVSALSTGATRPQDLVEGLLRGSFATSVSPVARLYLAYFLRPPDRSGLDYWVGRYRAGTSLTTISASFAGSQEFRTRYGTLTNRQFVERVYLNVLGRPGEPSGVTYWTSQLDQRRKTRGQVMVGFSESTEYKRVRAAHVDVVLLHRGLLARGATSAELTTLVGRIAGGTTVGRLILETLDSTEYRGRITA